MGAPTKSYSKKSSTLLAAFEQSMESDWNIRMCFAGARFSHSHRLVRNAETLSEFVKSTVKGSNRIEMIPEWRCRCRAADTEKMPTVSEDV
jgi:hypothetical protein